MKSKAYYNEIDPFAASWLRELIKAGHIADGDVDDRSIEDVVPNDLMGYTQCHFFAGIGGWSRSFILAGWPDDKPGWSASLPCQPFSIANPEAKGQRDERHLLPVFLRLVKELRPPVIFGEQVAKAIQWGWLDQCFGSLEKMSYACGSALLTASGYGASHERKRIYWLADRDGQRREGPESVEFVSIPKYQTFSEHSDPFSYVERALGGDFSHLLRSDGVPLSVERNAIKGYGNAIVPQVSQGFITAYMSLENGQGEIYG